MKGQRIQIDLKKNPELASLVSDMPVGAWVELQTSIVAKDDQTLTVEIEECAEGAETEEVEEEPEMEKSPAESSARGLESDEG